MKNDSTLAREKLSVELKNVLLDAEALLNATADDAGEKVQSVRARVEKTLKAAKANFIEEFGVDAVNNIKTVAKSTNEYVHENPWPTIGIAAGVGLLCGWLLSRK